MHLCALSSRNQHIIILISITTTFPIIFILYPESLVAWTACTSFTAALHWRCKLQLRWPAKCKWQTIQQYIKTFPNALRTPSHQINNLWHKIQFCIILRPATSPQIVQALQESQNPLSSHTTTLQMTQPQLPNLLQSHATYNITYPKVTKAGMRFVRKFLYSRS